MLRIACRRLFFRFDEGRISDSRCSFHSFLVANQLEGRDDADVDKLRVVLGGAPSLEALLAAEEQVIAYCISKVGFWRCKTQFVPAPPSSSAE